MTEETWLVQHGKEKAKKGSNCCARWGMGFAEDVEPDFSTACRERRRSRQLTGRKTYLLVGEMLRWDREQESGASPSSESV